MSTYADVVRRQALNPYLNLLTYFICGLWFLAFIYFGLQLGSDQTGMSYLYLLMVIQLSVPVITLTRGNFNYLVFVLMNHFFVYSFAKFNLITNIQKLKVVPKETINAFSEMAYCTTLIIFSYFFFRIILLPKPPAGTKFDFLIVSPRAYTWMGIFVCLQPYITLIMPGTLITLHTTLFAICLVVVFCSDCENQALQRWIKVGIAASAFQSFLLFGSLSVLGTIGSVFFIVTVIQRKTSNFIILALMVLFGLVFQSIKLEYRLLTRNDDNSVPIVERLRVISGLLAYKYLGDVAANPMLQPEEDTPMPLSDDENATTVEMDDVKDNLAKSLTRVGDDSLERVLTMTPSQVPFWGGETYLNIIYFFIPRFLWPGKPSRDMWNKFGRTYGFLSSDDKETSVGVNFLGEAYMNFGFTGLYSMAILFGILVACMEALSNVFLSKPNFFTFICFSAPFMNYGLDFGSIFNSMVLMIVLITLLRYRLITMVNRDVYA